MATLSTTAWVLHELGLAAGFGGNLFGQLALSPAVRAAESKQDRGKIEHVAWSRYKAVSGASLLAMAGTWLIGRTFLSGREVGRASRVLTLAKDVLVAGAVVSGIGSIVVGTLLSKAQKETGFAIEDGSTPAPETSPEVARLQRLVNVFGTANIGFQAGVLATTSMLAMKAGKSTKWSFVSKLLP
jgi:hypothetical protein